MDIFGEEDCPVSLGSLFQCSVIFVVIKKFSLVFTWNCLCSALCLGLSISTARNDLILHTILSHVLFTEDMEERLLVIPSF